MYPAVLIIAFAQIFRITHPPEANLGSLVQLGFYTFS
jgi:hypothetical protein